MSNLSYSTQFIDQEDIDGVIEILKGSHLTQGKKVQEFEEALCSYSGAKYAVTFNSATSALLGAYTACGICEDDEIITTPISFVATSNMFVQLGARPVWCDIKPDGNIDENQIQKLITAKTKAIVPIDFAGKPVEIFKINEIAKKHNLLLIQDSSHSLGSSIDGKKIGSLADMTIFSFHAIKPITTSEGGAVLTDNEEFANKLRLFRSHGMIKNELWKSDMISMGHNFRMTEVAASLGVTQIKKLDSFISSRNEIANYYNERFKESEFFTTIEISDNLTSSHHLYPILLNKEFHTFKEEIFKDFQEQGLGIQVHYKPIYQNSFYKEKFGEITLPVAEEFYNSEISIPCHQQMNLDDAKYVAETLINTLNKYKTRGGTL
jgi:UDP-4-amino-4,6-dideoxy-L-N-acetyl-beta-L-altrosamine transaminase